MRNYKRIIALGLTFALTIAMMGCGKEEGTVETAKTEMEEGKTGDTEKSEAGETIKIGYVNDLTGDGAGWGVPGMRGAQMAADEINANGGLLGRQIELIIQDGRGDPQDSVNAFNKLIGDGCIAVVGTTTSGPNIAMAPIADAAEIPLVGLGCSNELVTVDESGNIHPYSFRVSCIDNYLGTALGTYLADKGYKTAGILINQGDAYSVGISEAFVKSYEEAGGEVVIQENAYDTDSDFRAQLTNIKAAEPEVFVIPWVYTYVALISQQARELGLDMQYAGTDAWDVFDLGTMANGALEGAFYCGKQTFVSEESLAFKDKYLAAYPEETECGGESLLGWDAVSWLGKAITETNSVVPADIRDYLENTKNYDGLAGEFSVDEFHNLKIELCVYGIENNERTIVDFIGVE